MNITNDWDAVVADNVPNPGAGIGAKILDTVLGKANARMVYGDPVQHGDKTIIPVARISARFGFGGGGGKASTSDGPSSGSGGGGGGTVEATPIGYIEITPYGTEFHEIEDSTKIAMTAIRVAGVVTVLVLVKLLFLRRGRKKSRNVAAEVAARSIRQRLLRRSRPVEIVVEQPAPSASTPRWRRWKA